MDTVLALAPAALLLEASVPDSFAPVELVLAASLLVGVVPFAAAVTVLGALAAWDLFEVLAAFVTELKLERGEGSSRRMVPMSDGVGAAVVAGCRDLEVGRALAMHAGRRVVAVGDVADNTPFDTETLTV